MAVSVTQTWTQPFSTVTTGAVTCTGVATGSVIAVVAQAINSNNRTVTCDSGGVSKAAIVNATNVGFRQEIFVSTTAGSGTFTVTLTWSASATFQMTVLEIAGADTVNPVEASGTDTTTTNTGSPNLCNPSISYSAGSLLIGALGDNNAASVTTLTLPTGWTGISTSAAVGRWSGYIAQGSSGSGQFPSTYATARPYNGAVISIKAAAAASGGPFPHFLRGALAGGVVGPRGGLI